MKFVVKHIHFVGIGGTGMCGIAEVLLNLGYTVSGSDLSQSPVTERLQHLGATIYQGHCKENIDGADCLVVSSAVHESNPEVQAARKANIPVVPRAVMLAELMRLRRGIAIAGTHGKTTTTSLTTSMLAAGGLDPTYVIGGRLNSSGANAKLGTGEYIVAEADESDASFLNLSPVIAAVTNIDQDHMDTYGHDFVRLKKAFIDFIGRLPFYGVAVLCTDDKNVASIVPMISRRVVAYGLNSEAEVRAIDVRSEGTRMRYTILRKGHDPLPVVLNLPGMHNVVNSLAAVAIATLVGVSDEAIVRALAEFTGVGRRFAQYGEVPVDPEHPEKGLLRSWTITDTIRTKWPQRLPLRAAHGPKSAWFLPSSRIATRARATALKTSSRCSRRSTVWCSLTCIPPAKTPFRALAAETSRACSDSTAVTGSFSAKARPKCRRLFARSCRRATWCSRWGRAMWRACRRHSPARSFNAKE